jgi:hypothetical protein
MTFLLLRALIFAPVAIVVVALMRSLRAIADLRLWRRLTRNRPVAIRDLQPGRAIVRGKVRLLGQPLQVPFSDKSCVAYEISEPVRLGSTQKAAAFAIDDATGTIEVRPERMRVGAAVDHVLHIDILGMKTMPGLGRPIRLLREGDEVLVLGVARKEADAGGTAGSYRDAPTKLVMRPGPGIGLAAVRDVSSLIRYAAPTLVISGLVVAATLAGMGWLSLALFGCS